MGNAKKHEGAAAADSRPWIGSGAGAGAGRSFWTASPASPPPPAGKDLVLPVSTPPPGGYDSLLFKGSAMTRRGAYAAVSYMACAAGIAFHSTTGEPWTVYAKSGSLVSLEMLLETLPLSLSYLVYMLASMESIRGVNVPMYTTLRRTTVVFTMIAEYLLTRQKYSSSIVASVVVIVLGAFVAGAGDLTYDTYSYAIVFVANITTAIYLATIARVGKSSGLSSFGLMWCNGIVCGPILLFWTYFRGDLKKTLNFPHLYSPGFQAILLLSCIMAFLLNYTIFLNTTLNSALTQTICGNMKDLFTVGIGWLLFRGLPFDLLNVVGQSLGFLGSAFYAYCKLKGK